MRVVPLHVLFGDGGLPRPRRDLLARLLRAAADRARAADDVAADAAGLPRAYEELAQYERIYSLHLSAEALGDVSVGRPGSGRRRRRTGRVVDTETASLAVAHARARDRAAARPGHDRRRDRGADRALQAGQQRRLHGRHARVPAEGRPHRQGAGARRLAAQRQADPLGRGRRDRAGRQGARPPEGARGVRRLFERRRPRTCRGSGSRSRTPTRRSGST